ncbi:MAG: DUF484 family protein [Candidatus Porifericomitaceae bacterium WSBS_2022_MAG_OTU9]
MSQAECKTAAGLSEEEVGSYLLQAPDFLLRNPQVLQALETQCLDNSGGSLLQKQVQSLRSDNEKMRDALAAVQHIASLNGAASNKVGAMLSKLIATTGLEGLFQSLYATLVEDFAITKATVRIFPDAAASNDKISEGGRRLRCLFPEAQLLRTAQCGLLNQEQVEFLFGSNVADLRSFALVPLGSGGWHGMLCMGCEDKTRFTVGHDTQLLDHIGHVLTALLQPRLTARDKASKE